MWMRMEHTTEVEEVEFDQPVYNVQWNATELGEHILYTRFTDIKGNTFISNQHKLMVGKLDPPEITILFPHEGSTQTFAPNNAIPIVADLNYSGTEIERIEIVYAGNRVGDIVRITTGETDQYMTTDCPQLSPQLKRDLKH